MARRTRHASSKKFLYFFLNGKIHKVLSRSRAKDELYAWCYPDGTRVLYSLALVEKNMQRAYSLAEVSNLLNRHKVTLEDYIIEGKIRTPQRIYPIGKPESRWYKFMLNENDVMELHQFILDAGYTSNLPSKAELQALLKHNLILYTKTEEGKFVPVWKAE